MEWSKLGFQPKPKTLVIGEVIGRGAYATVCRGILDGKPVAVKRLPRVLLEVLEESSYHNLMQQFSHECKFLKSIDHLNIVKLIGAYYDDKTQEQMLVMELMEGDLKQYHLLVNKVNEQCKICKDVASALVYLHQQYPPIVHCDVTSGNILLSTDGHTKLAGFGSAQRKLSCGYFDTAAPGTMVYMPPEALLPQSAYDEKIDIFSLGVVMTEVVTQSPPSVGSGIGEVME
jgi:serine/threonine protein kinase